MRDGDERGEHERQVGEAVERREAAQQRRHFAGVAEQREEMQAHEQGGAGQQVVRPGFFGGEKEEPEEQGEARDDAGDAGTADAGDGPSQLVELILGGADDQREQPEGGFLGERKEVADPDDESDDDPQADGAEGAVFHAWAGGWTWAPVLPNRRSRLAYSARARCSCALSKSGQKTEAKTISA
jgi:hypothetical protein